MRNKPPQGTQEQEINQPITARPHGCVHIMEITTNNMFHSTVRPTKVWHENMIGDNHIISKFDQI